MNSYRNHLIAILFVSITAGASFEYAEAQQSDAYTSNEFTAILDCKLEINADKRLACYDLTVNRLQQAQNDGELVTVSRSQVENVERDSFGFNLPSLPKLGKLFGGSKKTTEIAKADSLEATEIETDKKTTRTADLNPQIDEIKTNLKSTQTFGYKKVRFFLEDGQVWEQIDSTYVRVPKKNADNPNYVVIKKAALGSFMLKVNDKGRAIRVRRAR